MPSAGGVITNTATVSAFQTDPDPSNNAATQVLTVVAEADLVVEGAPARHGTPTPFPYGTNRRSLNRTLTNSVDQPGRHRQRHPVRLHGMDRLGHSPSAGSSNKAVFMVDE